MIKINVNGFNWILLNRVYSKIAKRVFDKIRTVKTSNQKTELIETFEEYFGADELQMQENIYDFLLHADKRKMDEAILFFAPKNYDDYEYKVVEQIQKLSTNVHMDNVLKYLKERIKGVSPSEWETVRSEFEAFLENRDNHKRFTNQQKEIFFENNQHYKNAYDRYMWNSDISDLISFEDLTQEERHIILGAMNTEVCPYCNRQYISTWSFEDEEIRSTADIDHYYIKSKYPIVSLCLFNFIPSCQICNSRLKLQKDFKEIPHIYPYEEEFGKDGVFALDNIDFLYGNEPQYSIHFSGQNELKIKNSIQTFHINELYKAHTNYVSSIIQRAQMYCDSQIDEILEKFSGLFESKEELKNFIFGNYYDNQTKNIQTLSKLTRDLLEDLGIE